MLKNMDKEQQIGFNYNKVNKCSTDYKEISNYSFSQIDISNKKSNFGNDYEIRNNIC